jgi:2-iminoacetate synthase ThiH
LAHASGRSHAVEYLKNLPISRLFLSNFENVQSSWVTQGLKVCQMGLRFGGNGLAQRCWKKTSSAPLA